MNKPLRVRLPTYLLAFLFFLVGLAWVWWAAASLQFAVPGLIDDGCHIEIGNDYATTGFFHAMVRSFENFLNGARFYETQFALLGLFHICFGENLALWYAGNIFLGAISACALAYVVYAMSKDVWASLVAGALMLTSSPVAETLRGNFGKAEAIMVAFMAAGFALWVYSRRSRHPLPCLIGAGVLFVLACVSKESGKIVAIAICLPWIATLLPLGRDARGSEENGASFRGLFIIGLCGLLSSWLVSLPSRKLQYMQSYFQMDFSFGHITKAFWKYFTECPDFLIILCLVVLLYAALLWVHRNGDRRVMLGAACLAGALAYSGCLLGFRFHLSYYLFVPLALLSLSAGLGVAMIPKDRQALLIVIFAVFFLSRLYSIPYLFMISRAQQLFDSVNYKAMLSAKSSPGASVYALDIPEDCQMIQEWNILRRVFTTTEGASRLYGAACGFKAWGYQDLIRERPGIMVGDRLTQTCAATSDVWRAQMPKEGDYLSCRFGKMKVGQHYLRAVLPFAQKPETYSLLIDGKAVEDAGGISEKAVLREPGFLGKFQAEYGWKFYKVVRPLGFVLQGCTGDLWMTHETSFWIPQESKYAKLEIQMDVPQGHSYPFRVWAESEGSEIAATSIEAPGKANLVLPVHGGQTVKLYSSSWFQPRKVGIGKDNRELSVRFMKLNSVEATK